MNRKDIRIGTRIRCIQLGWIGTVTNISQIEWGYVSVTWDNQNATQFVFVSQRDVNQIEPLHNEKKERKPKRLNT